MTEYLHIAWLLVSAGWYWIALIAVGLALGSPRPRWLSHLALGLRDSRGAE